MAEDSNRQRSRLLAAAHPPFGERSKRGYSVPELPVLVLPPVLDTAKTGLTK
jgi:hypothetical protein